jgi:hypothetical protein
LKEGSPRSAAICCSIPSSRLQLGGDDRLLGPPEELLQPLGRPRPRHAAPPDGPAPLLPRGCRPCGPFRPACCWPRGPSKPEYILEPARVGRIVGLVGIPFLWITRRGCWQVIA